MNYQQVANYSVDPPLVATGQFFAATVMMDWQGPQHEAVKEESAMIGKILLTLAVIAVAPDGAPRSRFKARHSKVRPRENC